MKLIVLFSLFITLCSYISSTEYYFLKKIKYNKEHNKEVLDLIRSNDLDMRINKKDKLDQPPAKYQGVCFSKIKGYIYDLNPMGFGDDRTYLIKGSKNFIDFNFCKDIPNYCYDGSRGLIVDKLNCIRYAGEWKEDKEWKMMKFRNGTSKILVDFPEGDDCPQGGSYTVSFELICDPTLNRTMLLDANFNENACHNKLVAASPFACPIKFYVPWYKSFFVHKHILALFIFLLGVALAFFGLHIELAAMTFILGIAYTAILNNFLPYALNYHLALNFVLGLAIAFANVKIGAGHLPLIAVILGCFVGNSLFLFLNEYIDYDAECIFDYTLFFCICLSLLTHFLVDKYIVVFASAFIGAYAMVRGVSLFFGNFPDESYTIQLIMRSEESQLDKLMTLPYYYYVAFIFLIAIGGIVVQSILRPTPEGGAKEEINIEPIKPDSRKTKKKNETKEENQPLEEVKNVE